MDDGKTGINFDTNEKQEVPKRERKNNLVDPLLPST